MKNGIMKYKFLETNGDTNKKIEEIRLNIIRLHNRVCSTHVDENVDSAEYMIDVFDDCRSEFSTVIDIMLQLEGSRESYRERPKDELFAHLQELALQLQNEIENRYDF